MKKSTTAAKVAAPKTELQTDAKKRTGPESLNLILTEIRQHEPEDQNVIVENLLREIGIDRAEAYKSAAIAKDRAAENLELFMKVSHSAQAAIKGNEGVKQGY